MRQTYFLPRAQSNLVASLHVYVCKMFSDAASIQALPITLFEVHIIRFIHRGVLENNHGQLKISKYGVIR